MCGKKQGDERRGAGRPNSKDNAMCKAQNVETGKRLKNRKARHDEEKGNRRCKKQTPLVDGINAFPCQWAAKNRAALERGHRKPCF